MKEITRTFETHTITAGIFRMEGGEAKIEALDPFIIFNESITQEKAIKLARKKFGKELNLVVMDITTKQETYSLPVDEFLKHAKKVEKIRPEKSAETIEN